MKDIFIDIQLLVGCIYISDLPNQKREILRYLKKINLNNYSHKQLEDFSNYVFHVPFEQLNKSLERND